MTFYAIQKKIPRTVKSACVKIHKAVAFVERARAEAVEAGDKAAVTEHEYVLDKAAERLEMISRMTDKVEKALHQLALLCHDNSIPVAPSVPTLEPLE